MVSGKQGDGAIKVNQDVNIAALELDQGREVEYLVGEYRQAYLAQIEGTSDINGVVLNERDA